MFSYTLPTMVSWVRMHGMSAQDGIIFLHLHLCQLDYICTAPGGEISFSKLASERHKHNKESESRLVKFKLVVIISFQ